ncbi:MAG TPA: DUF402 domain-containing protein [Longilinea sp.]|nr:DUF402 domain-containing protein [Longilinea sp.]
MEEVTVIKLNPQGGEVFRYQGVIKQHQPQAVLVEAYFTRDDMPFHGTVFKKNDRFVEIYYTDRWYNILEIYDRDDRQLKCWYCNVSYPAEIDAGSIAFRDLALDLLVFPDGRQEVLDEDEFALLALNAEDKRQAQAALEQLQALFAPPVRVKLDQPVVK